MITNHLVFIPPRPPDDGDNGDRGADSEGNCSGDSKRAWLSGSAPVPRGAECCRIGRRSVQVQLGRQPVAGFDLPTVLVLVPHLAPSVSPAVGAAGSMRSWGQRESVESHLL